MNLIFKSIIIIALLIFSAGCLPDRMPPEPIEIDRPQFSSFADTSILNFNLDGKIVARFNEKMDLSTFPGNFLVIGNSGEMSGNFSILSGNDSAVVFTPDGQYNPAEYYSISMSSRISDANGMQMIAPHEENVFYHNWFFTTGKYAENGFPYIFVRDKVQLNTIYRVGNINKYIDSLDIESVDPDLSTSDMFISPDGLHLFMLNFKVAGSVTIIDPQTFSVQAVVDVDIGPTDLAFSSDKAFVVNNSGKSISVIDLNSLSVDTTFSFDDQFKPKGAAFSASENKLYLYATSSKFKKTIKVVNGANYADSYDLDSVLTGTKLSDIDISQDGNRLYLMEEKGDRVIVLNTETDKIETIIETGQSDNVQAAVGESFYYLAFFSGDQGGIIKIDTQTNSVVNEMTWGREIDDLSLTAAGELLYVITPDDSTVQVVETRALNRISAVKINGQLKRIVVSALNY